MQAVAKTLGVGLLAATAALGLAAVPAAAATTSAVRATAVDRPAAVGRPAADSPPGFSYGTDSWPVSGTGTAPYKEPVIGGSYGGYIGMAGNWARTEGCSTGNFLAWAPANSAQANTNYTKYHVGISASEPASTGTWAGLVSIRTGMARPRKRTDGECSKGRGRSRR
jgi:hypothetical protein